MHGGYYKNGQIVKIIKDDYLTYYYKNGVVKAHGKYVLDKMEDEWKFYHEDGSLWQIGNFKNNIKHGFWIRYNKNNEIEYNEIFIDGKKVKK